MPTSYTSFLELLNGSMFINTENGDSFSWDNITSYTTTTDAEGDDTLWTPFDFESDMTMTFTFSTLRPQQLKRILWGWTAKGPVRVKNIMKAMRRYMNNVSVGNDC